MDVRIKAGIKAMPAIIKLKKKYGFVSTAPLFRKIVRDRLINEGGCSIDDAEAGIK